MVMRKVGVAAAIALVAVASTMAGPARAQESSDNLAKQLSNPVANLISVPFQFNAADHSDAPLPQRKIGQNPSRPLPDPSVVIDRAVAEHLEILRGVGELSGTPNSGAPSIHGKSYTTTAEVGIPTGGAEGMIVTYGIRFGGNGLLLTEQA